MIITDKTQLARFVEPFVAGGFSHGMRHGATETGYDFRLGKPVVTTKGAAVCVSLEKFKLPSDVMGMVVDKGTLVRQGIHLTSSVLAPGWHGHLVFGIDMFGRKRKIDIPAGFPIGSVVFMKMSTPAVYEGKYQDQAIDGPLGDLG